MAGFPGAVSVWTPLAVSERPCHPHPRQPLPVMFFRRSGERVLASQRGFSLVSTNDE